MKIDEAFDHLDNMISAGVTNDDETKAIGTIRKALEESQKTPTNNERDVIWLCQLRSGNCSKRLLVDGKYTCYCEHRQKSPVS